MPPTNNTEGHRTALDAPTNDDQEKSALSNPFLNDQIVAAITASRPDDTDGRTEFQIKPLFVSIFDGQVSPCIVTRPTDDRSADGFRPVSRSRETKPKRVSIAWLDESCSCGALS